MSWITGNTPGGGATAPGPQSARKRAGVIALALCALVSAGIGTRLAFQPTVARGGCDANGSGYGYGPRGTGYGYGYGPGDDGCDPDGTFIPVTPTRLLDGRLTTPPIRLGPLGTTDVQVTGVAGVPATGVTAVVVNLTVDAPTAPSYFQLYPTGGNTFTSNLNFEANQTRAADSTVKVGTNGRITIRNETGQASPILDIQGYYAAVVSPTTGSSYVPLASPVRGLDTRTQPVGPPVGRFNANETRTFTPAVPAGATAVVATFTSVNPTERGFLTAYPDGTPRPTVSNLNWERGRTIPNLATVPLGTGGRVALFTNQPTDLLIDITGYYVSRTSAEIGDRFTAVDPARLGDSRATSGNIGGLTRFTTMNQTQQLRVTGVGGVPATGVSAVVITITGAGVASNPDTFFTAFPAGSTLPVVSNLNPIRGENAANLAIVRVGTGGNISLLNFNPSAEMVIDVYGYFRGV